jgi:endonuclease G
MPLWRPASPRGPLWSAEHLTAQALTQAHATAREGHFHEDERLPPADRATLADYVRSGYDRGHMTPSGDMSNLAAQQESFSLANVVPQTPKLNRDVWEGIESAVRRLAQDQGELYVVTGPAFLGQELQSLQGHVDPMARGGAAYICTNVSRPRCHTLSLAALAQVTGADPFPAVPEDIKRTPMRLPALKASPYTSSGRHGHHRQPQFSLRLAAQVTAGWL